MKFTAIAALATAVSGAAIHTKRDAAFEVTEFAAACVPHSAMCNYSFYAFQPGTYDQKPGYKCEASAPGAGVEVLPNITHGSCAPSSRFFDVERVAEGLKLTVSVQVSRLSYTRGTYTIPYDQIEDFPGTTPTGGYQAYTGPKDFSLERVF